MVLHPRLPEYVCPLITGGQTEGGREGEREAHTLTQICARSLCLLARESSAEQIDSCLLIAIWGFTVREFACVCGISSPACVVRLSCLLLFFARRLCRRRTTLVSRDVSLSAFLLFFPSGFV